MQVAVFNEFTRKVLAEISATDSADVIKAPTKLAADYHALWDLGNGEN